MLDNSNMSRDLKSVVAERLGTLGRNPFEAARVGKLERSYINDILIGRKSSIRDASFAQVAAALDWKPADLMEALGRVELSAEQQEDRIVVTKGDFREVVMLVLLAANASEELSSELAEAAVNCLSSPPLDALDGDVVRSFAVRLEMRDQRASAPRSQ